MSFNSFEFFLFFPIVTILYFILPHKFRWVHLLVASCYFYIAFVPAYILIIFFTIIIDYLAGILIEKTAGHSRKLLLALSIVANVGVLAIFKYYNFIVLNINELLPMMRNGARLPLLHMLLPIGLSFHTFQAMSYTIEVYRGNQKAEKHLGIYALYVMFYPQMVAGPIERPQHIIHQLKEEHTFDYDNAVWGCRMILWGMLKKMAIADRLALVTDPVFDHPHRYSGTALCIASVFFAFQIFCDFSGYSDIALGTARILGIQLMTNFNWPYSAESISEFWKKWHISLSTWFRDYLYFPLGGSRVAIPRGYLNLFIVFLISGLWHGANWTFVAWGALHGILLILEKIARRLKRHNITKADTWRFRWLQRRFNTLMTFSLVTIAWVFFRAANLREALYIIGQCANAPVELVRTASAHNLALLHLPNLLRLRNAGIAILALEAAHIVCNRYKLLHQFKDMPAFFRWPVYAGGLCCFFFYGVFEQHQFIYFQF